MIELAEDLPQIRVPLTSAEAEAAILALADSESPGITARRKRRAEKSGAAQDPIVWKRAEGALVEDNLGNRFVDFTSGFGVAAFGHRPNFLIDALHKQMDLLVHGLGDVHPHQTKIELLQELMNFAAEFSLLGARESLRGLLALGGGDAIEIALKTAALHTRKPGVLAFVGGYHGLAYGPLAHCGYSENFRRPFVEQLNPHVAFVAPPTIGQDANRFEQSMRDAVREASLEGKVGAVLLEPFLGRGGTQPLDAECLRRLRSYCDEVGALLIVDEIWTGFGRCGETFLHTAMNLRPDVLCIGKALGAGMPISACISRLNILSSWGDPDREALHTGTFYGHPLSCAAALAFLRQYREQPLDLESKARGEMFRKVLQEAIGDSPLVREIRGQGLAVGVELRSGTLTLRVVRALLELGYIALPSGMQAETLQLSPPLLVGQQHLQGLGNALRDVLRGLQNSSG